MQALSDRISPSGSQGQSRDARSRRSTPSVFLLQERPGTAQLGEIHFTYARANPTAAGAHGAQPARSAAGCCELGRDDAPDGGADVWQRAAPDGAACVCGCRISTWTRRHLLRSTRAKATRTAPRSCRSRLVEELRGDTWSSCAGCISGRPGDRAAGRRGCRKGSPANINGRASDGNGSGCFLPAKPASIHAASLPPTPSCGGQHVSKRSPEARGRAQRSSTSGSRRTCSGIRLRRTCSRRERISAPCRNCWSTRAWRRRRFTRMSCRNRGLGCGARWYAGG